MLRRALESLWALQRLTCREATRLAAHAMDRPLTLGERLRLSFAQPALQLLQELRSPASFLAQVGAT